jgi:hypothetical protein
LLSPTAPRMSWNGAAASSTSICMYIHVVTQRRFALDAEEPTL